MYAYFVYILYIHEGCMYVFMIHPTHTEEKTEQRRLCVMFGQVCSRNISMMSLTCFRRIEMPVYIFIKCNYSQFFGSVKLFQRPSLHMTVPRLKVNFLQLSPPVCESLDSFVVDLMNTKSELWKSKSRIKQEPVNHKSCALIPKSAACIFTAARNGELELVSKLLQCYDLQQNQLSYLHKIFIDTCNVEGIKIVEHFSANNFSHSYVCRLKHYKEVGDLVKALMLCEDIYFQRPELRREVRGHLMHIIFDLVNNHSEAALVKSLDLVYQLVASFKDYRPMAALWHACFLSEWFSDQQVASKLLAHIAEDGNRQVLERRLMAAVFTALAHHRPQLVFGLLEDILRNKLLDYLPPVLRALFDYKCAQGDLKGCAAILRTSLEFDVSLTSQQHARFLDLLCHRRSSKWFKKLPKEQIKVKGRIDPPPFELKF